jgi:hypothetical protein
MVFAALLPLAAHQADAAAAPVYPENVPVAAWRADGVGWATLIVGNTVYVGGTFSTVRSNDGAQVVNRANLAAFDVRTGELISTFTADTNGIVRSLVSDGQRLYVGGLFTTVNGQPRRRVAAVDLATGAVDPTFRADASSNVYALALGGGKLFVGGTYSTFMNVPRSRIAAVDLATGALDPYAPTTDGTVIALAANADASRVYLGGQFLNVNGTSSPYLATTDAAGALASPTLPTATSPVQDLSLSADGTRLASANATDNNSSIYNTATGGRIWRQRCGGDNQAVQIVDGSVFSGFHEECDGNYDLRLTGNLLSNGARDTDFMPTFDRFWGVRAIDGNSSYLVIGGDFTRVSGVAAQGFAIFPMKYIPPPPASLPADATWSYLVTPTAAPDGWNQPGFDASSWPTGGAELGYGDGDETTTIGYGPNANSKYITTYFRTTFTSTSVPLTASLDMIIDDGAVVYVNGVEVARDNMPSGTIAYSTRAASGRSGSAESTVRTFAIPPSSIVAGTNTIAVEVHQDAPSSSDLSFSVALTSTGDPNAPTTTTSSTTTTTTATTTTTTLPPPPDTTAPATSITSPTDGATVSGAVTVTADATDDVGVSNVDLLVDGAVVASDQTAPYSFTWNAVEGAHTLQTSASDAAANVGTSTVVNVTVPAPPPGLFTELFGGVDGSAWPAAWTSSASNGSVTQSGGAGALTFNDVSGAYARAQLTAMPTVADSETLLSYRWASTGPVGYFSVYARGSGGWANAYRPRNGYGVELASNSTSVTVRRVVNGSVASVRTVAGANVATTAKQWLRLRVVGSTIQFKTWVDGQAEPSTWRSTDTDANVTAPGQLFASYVRGGANSGVRSVELDDLFITDGA